MWECVTVEVGFEVSFAQAIYSVTHSSLPVGLRPEGQDVGLSALSPAPHLHVIMSTMIMTYTSETVSYPS